MYFTNRSESHRLPLYNALRAWTIKLVLIHRYARLFRVLQWEPHQPGRTPGLRPVGLGAANSLRRLFAVQRYHVRTNLQLVEIVPPQLHHDYAVFNKPGAVIGRSQGIRYTVR